MQMRPAADRFEQLRWADVADRPLKVDGSRREL